MIKLKIDSVGRIYIPKIVLDMMNIKPNTEVIANVNQSNNTITISLSQMNSIKYEIRKRLEKNLNQSERNFLINLLNISEVTNDKDNS